RNTLLASVGFASGKRCLGEAQVAGELVAIDDHVRAVPDVVDVGADKRRHLELALEPRQEVDLLVERTVPAAPVPAEHPQGAVDIGVRDSRVVAQVENLYCDAI